MRGHNGLMRIVANTMTPERALRIAAVLDRRQPDLTVVTDNVHKGHNLSAIVRTCDAVGVLAVHTVVPVGSYRPRRGTAMGSQRWVDVVAHADLGKAIATVRGLGMQVLAAHLSDAAVDYREIDYTRPTAILMGAEKDGVSAEGIAAADYCITIPMVGMVASYNVSVAAALILNEAWRQRESAGLYERCRVDAATRRRLFFRWAHPKIAAFCDRRAIDYPPVDEHGEVIEAAAWMAGLRSVAPEG